MQYHVAKNGEKSGPFEQEEVYRRLVAGELSGSDLGWREGLAEWAPLSTLLPPQSAPAVISGSGATVFAPVSPVVSPSPNASAKSSGLAIGSLVCGILGLILWLPCLPAVILGHLGLSAIKKSAGTLKGRGMAISGLVTGYLMIAAIPLIAILAALAIPAFNGIERQARELKFVTNARQLIVGMKQYAITHDDNLPPTLEVLVEEEIVARDLLDFSPKDVSAGQGWAYKGAGHKDSEEGDLLVLTTLKPVSPGKMLWGHLDGSVKVAKRE